MVKKFIIIFVLFLTIVITACLVSCSPTTEMDRDDWYFTASLDGRQWEGTCNYSVHGPLNFYIWFMGKQYFSSVPKYMKHRGGEYDISYVEGGPENARFYTVIRCSKDYPWDANPYNLNQNTKIWIKVQSPQYAYFRFIFISTGEVELSATLDGMPWSGKIDYTLQGPRTQSGSSVPQRFTELDVGTYTITHNSGGPPGASLADIYPSSTEDISRGETASFILAFKSDGNIEVNATLDGKPWSGDVNYSVVQTWFREPLLEAAPAQGSSAPQSFQLPVGAYTISYYSGGPQDAVLSSISPLTQNLNSGETTSFTLAFESICDITVNAKLDGEPWTGDVGYTVQGPEAELGSSVPQSFTKLPIGTYTIAYNSGGPQDAVLSSISPSTMKELYTGDTATFTLDFTSVGEVVVDATLDGEPWSGDVSYTIEGPETETDSWAPQSFELPIGTYTITYNSGGPPDASLAHIFPSPTEELSVGESITFTLIFLSPDVPGADLSVSKTVDDETPNYGETVTYTITVTNSGPDAATGVQITDVLPDWVTYTGDSTSQGTYSPDTGIWGVGTLADGASATLQITATVINEDCTITNTAELTAVDQADPDSVPNNHNPDEDDQDDVAIIVPY